MPDVSQVREWRGQQLVDREGDKVGKIEEIFLDAETEQPEWLAVKTGMFGGKLTFVPLAEAREQDGTVQVPYEKAQIKDAPNVQADRELSQDEEAQLYQHYGLEYGESRSDTGLPQGQRGREDRDDVGGRDTGTVGRDISGPKSDDAMTRSEEELRVDTVQRESGRARMRKYIVTEDVQQTVPVQREEVRVEREPITDANRDAALTGGDLTEQEHEVTLHEDEVVVDKKTVPKERVRMDKDVSTEQREVTEQVRKEQIETEGTEGTSGGRRRR